MSDDHDSDDHDSDDGEGETSGAMVAAARKRIE